MAESADPPAYTPTLTAAPTTTHRSIEDTRALILSNAQMLRPRLKTESHLMIVLGKTKPLAAQQPDENARSFTHSASNTTIRIANTSVRSSSVGSGGSGSSSSESVARRPTAQRQAGRHFASLVARGNGQPIQQIVRGQPQDTIEEALAWLLDRTEIIVTAMLDRHARRVASGCCMSCDGVLTGQPVDES